MTQLSRVVFDAPLFLTRNSMDKCRFLTLYWVNYVIR